MRILTVGNMYPPHHLGGYELLWRSCVEHLRATGHRVRVLTTDYRNPAPDPYVGEEEDVWRELCWYWRDHEFPRISPRGRVTLERHNGRVLQRHLRELRPDVVSWWAMGGMSLSLVERVRRLALPAVGVVIDDWMLYGPQVDAWIRLARRLGPLAPLAGGLAGVPARLDFSRIAWVFCSEYTRGRALASQPRLDLTEVAHPGVDTDLFRPAPERSWGWRLLYVGRIDERKGIRTAVEALPRLPGEARLTVVGSGDEQFLAELHELGEQLGVADRVDFAQRPRNELPATYAAADVLLFPVRWGEPWGLVPLEAMAVGTPVVATGTGGSGEYLRDGENALVVGHEAGPEEFAAAVRRLATEPALRARLRERGLETAAGFTERAYNERIEAALVSAAQGG